MVASFWALGEIWSLVLGQRTAMMQSSVGMTLPQDNSLSAQAVFAGVAQRSGNSPVGRSASTPVIQTKSLVLTTDSQNTVHCPHHAIC